MSDKVIKYEDLSNLEFVNIGGYGKIYKAEHVSHGTVAYKELGAKYNSDELKNEAEIHFSLDHPNIVKMLGSVTGDDHFGLVLEYMEYGDMTNFLCTHKPDYETKFRLISEIASGMEYLHSRSPPVIHGDLKITNVLISKGDHAKISDFGFSKLKCFSQSHSAKDTRLGTVTHVPPESFQDPTLRRNEEFDVYGFGILIWEILTEKRAYEAAGGNASMISLWVQNGKRPEFNLFDSSDDPYKLQKLSKSCWDQNRRQRPTFSDIREHLHSYANEQELSKSEVETYRQNNPQFSDTILKVLDDCANEPQMDSLKITEVGTCHLKLKKLIGRGWYGEIYEAEHVSHGIVAFKVVEIGCSKEELRAAVDIRSSLSHPNLVMLHGCDIVNDNFGIVLEYMEHGDIFEFVRDKRSGYGTKLRLISDVAAGMDFLHSRSPPVIHGDLNAKNVLISKYVQAKITNFGFSNLSSYSQSNSTENIPTEIVTPVAPEYVGDPTLEKNEKFDVYKFGTMICEIITEQSAFDTFGAKPCKLKYWNPIKHRSMDNFDEELTALKMLSKSCWDPNPRSRPQFTNIVERLQNLIDKHEDTLNSRIKRAVETRCSEFELLLESIAHEEYCFSDLFFCDWFRFRHTDECSISKPGELLNSFRASSNPFVYCDFLLLLEEKCECVYNYIEMTMEEEQAIERIGNEQIKQVIQRYRSKFDIRSDPKGHIVRRLFDARIITETERSQIDAVSNGSEFTDLLLKTLCGKSHSRAFVVFCQALQRDHEQLLVFIDEKFQSYVTSRQEGAEQIKRETESKKEKYREIERDLELPGNAKTETEGETRNCVIL